MERRRGVGGRGRGWLERAGARLVLLALLGVTGCGASLPSAIRRGDQVAVERALTRHPERVNRQSDLGYTPLHIAAEEGNAPIAEYLVAHGADVHALTTDGETPLVLAAMAGSLPICSLLLDKGADVNSVPEVGWPALHRAVAHGARPVVELLVTRGADLRYGDSDGDTVLHV
ncbi:MAG TPA: ankyrin repeat domain-containing protein, partial [Polyangiaceae bacterium]|nr:ankyrin repeat domain-containing protein [Polyangiaceae bacterium]